MCGYYSREGLIWGNTVFGSGEQEKTVSWTANIVFEIHVEKDFFGTVVNLFTGSGGGSNGGGGGVGDLIAHPHSILQQSCNNSAAAAAAAQAAAACAAQAAAQCHDRLKLFNIWISASTLKPKY